MADIDILPPRGIRVAALVDGNGIASNGSQTVAQLAARGMRAECAVDATGVSTSGANMLQIAQRGFRAFCPVSELGIAQDATTTAATLRQRGIRPVVLLDANGIALNGSANMATLAQRGLQSFCPVDEAGNATTMGAVILVSNTTVLDNATVGTNVGTLSVAGGTGTYTFTLTSNPGTLFATAGTNGVNLNTAAALTAGDKPITVQAAGGVPTPISRALVITVAPAPTLPANTVLPVISGSTVVGQTLTTTNGTWTGFPAPGFTYQWKRGGVAISGATGNTYLLVSADVGTNITVTVTATNTAGSASATATAVGPVTIAAPINSAIPVISGSTVQGDVLTTTNGTWTGSPTFTYQWKRGVTNVGTNSTTYTTVSGDVGSTITVTVTATNAGGNASATSAGVGPITAAVGGSLATPTLTSLTTATDTGASSTDLITNDTTPDLNVDWGADAPLTGDVIEVSNNGALIVTHTVTADEESSGVLVLDFPLSEGSNSLTVTHKRGASASSPSSALVVVIDTIAPTLASPTGVQVLQTTAALTVSTNDATGTLYYVVTASATPPSKAQIKAGQDNAGAAAIYAGSQVVVTAGGKTATATGLNTNGTRYAYYMHEDIAGNQSAVSSATWAQVNLSAGGVLTYKAGPTAQTGTTASFTAIPIGAAAADRIVVVCMKAAFNTGNTLTVTLNSGAVTSSGIAQDNGNQYVNIFYKLVPTGTTCQVDVTCTGTAANMGQCQIAVYTITGCQFAHSGSGSTAWDVTFASMGVTATVPTDGVAVAAFGTDRVTTGIWSGNATLDLAVSGPVTEELIALSVRSLTGAQTVTKTPNPTNYAAVMLCWGP